VSVFNRMVIILLLSGGTMHLSAQRFHHGLLGEPLHSPSVSTVDSLRKPVFHDSWFSRDKGLHGAGSLILTAAVFNVQYRFGKSVREDAVLTSVGTALMVGISKELFDASRVNNHFSYKDLIYDVLGIMIAGVLISSD